MGFNNVATLVKSKRREKQISQTELSKALGYKNGQFISNVERSLCGIPLKNVVRLSEIIGATQEEIKEALMMDYADDVSSVFSPSSVEVISDQ